MLFKTSDLKDKKEVVYDAWTMEREYKYKVQFNREAAALEKEIKDLSPGQALLWTSNGAWSTYSMLYHLLVLAGASKVVIASWAFSEDALRTLVNLKEKGLLKELHILTDERIRNTAPKLISRLEGVADSFKMGTNHSKVMAILGENKSFLSLGSANMSKNRRLEAGTLINDKKAALQYYNYFLNEIKRGTNQEH